MKIQAEEVDFVARELAMKLFGGDIPEVWGAGTQKLFYRVPRVVCSEKARMAIIAKFGKIYKGHKIYFEISNQHPDSTSRPIAVELL